MPRPTRTRGASRRPAAPVAKEPSPAPPQDAGFNDIYDTSDREEARRRSRRVSERSTSRTAPAPNPRQAAAIEAARVRRDAALSRLENITSPSATANTNTAGEDTESSIEVELGRRAVAATPAHGARLHDLSGLELDDSMFDDLNTTIDTAGPASAQRSLDTSTLSASHFKRRPRAGSFLSRDDGPVRPSSRAGPNTPGISSTFNIGVFKRRAREPSILGTAQKPRAERPVPRSENGDRSEDDEAEEEGEEQEQGEATGGNQFSPEAESTPLRRSKRQSGAVEPAEGEGVVEVPSSLNKRKRKSTEAHEQRRRSSPHDGSDEVIPATAEDPEDEVDESALSSPPSLPPVRRQSTPLMENVAPPESSGSEDEAEVWPPLQSLAKGRSRRPPSALRKTPVREIAHDDSVSDMSSPPSLTYSPNYADPSPPPQKQTRAAAKPVTTADLTGLLPRRRLRNDKNDPFGGNDSDDEVVNTGLANDEDELSYLDVRTRRRPARPLSGAGKTNQPAKSTQRSKGKAAASAKPARTYGRSADKENQEGEDEQDEQDGQDDDAERQDNASENSQELVARVGEELKNAARKFAEVDRWELEFEENTQSSSPRDAR
ncbi:hypothetical protein BKA67DRAFT_658439 [Truncatella angustata]|uniref:Uncharacterized protein n=1 Tax=Truncatella angustata TaxID=152316 RepID=A0A9P8UL06_9PEZI|nr:uncharacterized protein BKA67DRAFT_658439 [Truncatella angustata]KAH6654116.1 hypothetical protein BKA67DRAFT_658439 [Truncatella angustata]